MAGEAFEDGDGRFFGLDHGRPRDDERLFEGVLTFEDRVADGIGEDHPVGARSELPALLGAALLESGVFLHCVVTAVHEIVVGRTTRAREIERSGETAHRVRDWIGAERRGQANSVREMRAKGFEGLRGDPDAALRGIEIGKEAKDAVAVGWTGWKGIEVREVIAGVDARGTTPLFDRAKAGEIESPFSGIGKQEIGEESDDAPRVITHDGE